MTKYAEKLNVNKYLLSINKRLEMNTEQLLNDKKTFNNSQDMLKDLLYGDPKALDRFDKLNLDKHAIKIALDFITKNEKLDDKAKLEMLDQSWRILYRAKPPTPEDFLTNKYIGTIANSIYDRVKTPYLQFLDPNSPYLNLILFCHIGFGKSFISTLSTLYITTVVSLMRDPTKYFGLSKATQICQMLCSYSLKKSSELLVAPFNNILEASPFFEKVSRRDAMAARVEEFATKGTVDKIYYTTASMDKSSVLEFDSGLTIKVASDPKHLTGLTLLSIVFSELAFFTDAGKSSDFIMRLWNDGVSRVESRFHGHYLGKCILDSSPNSLESSIDSWIVYDAPKNPKNLIVSGSMWKWDPQTYQKEFNNHETFKVYTGGRGTPPRILLPNDVLLDDPNIPSDKIIEIPNSQKQYFIDDLVKSLKDRAGIPSGSADSLITDYSIIENMFLPNMRNIYTTLDAPSTVSPFNLIWSQVSAKFFRNKAGVFEYYYKPWIPRVVSVDQSENGDLTGISMCHKERSFEKDEDTFVIDFSLAIMARENEKINLEAIRCFINDLKKLGNLRIEAVSFDNFQSAVTLQNLERDGFKVKKLSVDRETGPYLNFISLLNQHRVYCGRNIFLKNNIKSLHMVRSKKSNHVKIDHDSSREQVKMGDSNWDTSQLGYFGKDISDSVVASIELCSLEIPLAEDNFSLKDFREENAFDTDNKEAQKDLNNFMVKMGFKF